MAAHGVRVQSPRGDFEAHPAATDDIAAVAEADVVFAGLKAYSLPALAPAIGPLLRPDAVVVFAQNGIPWWYFHGLGGALAGRIVESVDPGGVVTAAIGPQRAIGCVLYCATEVVSPGVIRHLEGSRFSLGTPAQPPSERCGEVAAAFRSAGLKAPVERDLRPQIWLKLIGNAAFNPVTTLTGRHARRARGIAAHARGRARGHGGVRGGRRSASASRCPSRSIAAWRAPSPSATTAPRCCRTSRRASRSSPTA